MTAFRVGQPVVCVNAPWTWDRLDPTLGLIARIKQYFSRHPAVKETLIVTDVEGKHGGYFLCFKGFGPRQYRSIHFRPLSNVTKTLAEDVATFLPCLTPDLETASDEAASISAMAKDAQTAFSGEGA